MAVPLPITLEFNGGSEFLVGDIKEHKVQVPTQGGQLKVKDLFVWIKREMLKDCDRPELLFDGDAIRAGILVLVNECDWELLENEETKLKANDTVTFISTLHGG